MHQPFKAIVWVLGISILVIIGIPLIFGFVAYPELIKIVSRIRSEQDAKRARELVEDAQTVEFPDIKFTDCLPFLKMFSA